MNARVLAVLSKALAAGLLLLIADVGRTWAATPEEIKIGCIFSVTGSAAVLGRTAQMAMEDHIHAVNARGGIMGRKIRLIVYDDKSNYEEAMVCINRLISQDHVAGIIGNGWAHSAVQMAPLCASARIPFIASMATYSGVTKNVSGTPWPYTFRVCFTVPAQAAALADYAVHALGKRQAALLYDINTYNGMEFSTRFESEFTRLGGKVVTRQTYTVGVTTDFRAKFAQIGSAKPDCILVSPASGQQYAQMIKQAHASGLKCTFLSDDSFPVSDLHTPDGLDLEGVIFPAGHTTEDPRFAAFNARFFQAHGIRCETNAYYTLDAEMALEHATRVSLEKTGKIVPETMKNALETMRNVAVFTGKLTMDPKTHNPRGIPVQVVAIRDGKWVTVKTY